MTDKRCSSNFRFCWCKNENLVRFFQYAPCNSTSAELFTYVVLFPQVQQEIQVEIFLGEYLPIAVFFAIAIGLSAAFVLSALCWATNGLMKKKWRPMNVGLTHLMTHGGNLMCGFIWSLSYLLFSTWKWRFYSHGQLPLAGLACLDSGQ